MRSSKEDTSLANWSRTKLARVFEEFKVTLVTGARNRLWHRDSIDRMHEWLCRGSSLGLPTSASTSFPITRIRICGGRLTRRTTSTPPFERRSKPTTSKGEHSRLPRGRQLSSAQDATSLSTGRERSASSRILDRGRRPHFAAAASCFCNSGHKGRLCCITYNQVRHVRSDPDAVSLDAKQSSKHVSKG